MTRIINNIAEGIEKYPLKSKKLWIPELENIIPYLESALRENYQKVSVKVIDCPDLTKFGCAAPGLGGSPKLVESGGEPFNHDFSYNKDVYFEFERMVKM